jgi:DNA-binding transcriptional MerR regulator
MNERNFYIGEVAKNLQISQRTIRYYEELGFIKPGRTEGKFRVYAESEVNRLKTILYLKELGMALEEIGALLKLGHEGSVHDISPKLREALIARKKEFAAKLDKYREGLRELEGVLKLIEKCIECHKKTDQETCHHCIDLHSGELPPLVRILL